MYAFAKPEAIRSFREAWKRDPNCAICYWGEAWAWGSYLNGPMNADEAPHAYAAIQKALALKGHASAKERAFIDAMAVRYVEKFDPEKRVDQDKAYAEAMGRVAEAYPDDLEAATLHADALFLLEPRRGTRDVKSPSVQRLHRVLERILAKDVKHPGACHLYVHATESTVVPERAVGVRRISGQVDSGRQPHQPYAVAHLERSWAVGRFGAREPRGMALRFESGDWRGLRDLSRAQSAHAAVCGINGRPGRDRDAGREGLREADWRFVLPGADDDQVRPVRRGARGEESPGRRHSGRVMGLLAGLRATEDRQRRFREGLSRAREESRGHARKRPSASIRQRTCSGPWRAFSKGRFCGAPAIFPERSRCSSRRRRSRTCSRTTNPRRCRLPRATGWARRLLEAKRYADAERVYREELEDHPHNGWSLIGLQKALAGRGVTSAEVDADLAKSWSRADTWIRTSRF